MDKDTLTSLFHYHYWANRRLWPAIMALSDEQFAHVPDGGGSSVHAQLVGMVASENLWVNYLWHGEVEFLEATQFPTRASIRSEWDALEEETLDFIDELRPAELTRQVDAPFLGSRASARMGDILLYVVQHAVERRAELCLRLQQVGAQPPAKDYLAFAAEQAHHKLAGHTFTLASAVQEAWH